MALKKKIAAEIKSRDLTITGAAAAIGVTFPSLRALLDGKSLPNARSIGKYASFLGVSTEALTAEVDKEKDRTGVRPGRPKGAAPKAAKVKKAAKKTVKAKPAKPAKAKPAKAKAKPGPKPKAAAPAAAPKVDKRVISSLKASLKALDDLKGKIESSIAKLEG